MTFTPQDMIRYASVPGFRNVFALGCFETRVTIHSQQVRALNLVYALEKTDHLVEGTHLAVVGAGFCGLTVAAAASRRGASVTLFETKNQLLHLQRGCSTRRIHPRVFDWPLPVSEESDAKLPLLTWSAAPAQEVVRRILEQWQDFAADVDVRIGIRVLRVTDTAYVVVDDPTTLGGRSEPFDCVVLCVGFGLERDLHPSYWRIDDFEQSVLEEGPRKYLVSGLGDGAIADVLRLRLGDGNEPFDEWLADHWLPLVPDSLRRDILRLERSAQLLSAEDAVDLLVRTYARHLAFGVEELLSKLRERTRNDTDVIWAGPQTRPYALKATPLNRFVAAALFATADPFLKFVPGKLRSGPILQPLDGGVERDLSDRHWVPRHGPDRAFLKRVVGVPAFERLKAGVTMLGMDAPRTQIWPDGHFDEPRVRRQAPSERAPIPRSTTLYALVEESLASALTQQQALTEDASIQTRLGYGVLATTTEEEAHLLGSALKDAVQHSFERLNTIDGVARADDGLDVRGIRAAFRVCEVLLPLDAEPLPLTNAGELPIEGNVYRVHCILSHSLERVVFVGATKKRV